MVARPLPIKSAQQASVVGAVTEKRSLAEGFGGDTWYSQNLLMVAVVSAQNQNVVENSSGVRLDRFNGVNLSSTYISVKNL